MFAAILVGGKGTRMKSFSKIPKPLLKIRKKEILKWIIDIYHDQGVKDYYLLCRSNNLSDFQNFKKKYKKYNIKVIDTGLNSSISKRISYVKNFIGKNKYFFLTYGDSIANFNKKKSLKKLNKKKMVVTLHKKKFPYGEVKLKNNNIQKYVKNNSYKNINAGFYVVHSNMLNLVQKNKNFEKLIFNKLVKSKEINSVFSDIWYPIDNKEDLILAENYLINK